MKRMDILCASQASTAICLSMEQASCSSPNTVTLGGGRAIDRHNPIINDSRRRTTSKSVTVTAPCSSSQPPINPKPYHKAKKNDNRRNAKKKSIADENNGTTYNNNYHSSSKPIDSILRRSWVKGPGSTRCLLSDTAFFDGSSYYDPVSVSALTKVEKEAKVVVVHQDETRNTSSSKPSSASASASASHPKSGSSHQVVVLRVSLHCKGCEGKVRKHLSRMQGVTSFNIDFAAKKVTVVGDVTPLSVLASISKVKNAQFWPAPASAVGSATIETEKNNTLNTQINPIKI